MVTCFPKPAAGVLFALLMASPVLAANNGANGTSANAPGHDRVCLVTFNSESAVAAGRNVDVVGTKLLPRKAAQAQPLWVRHKTRARPGKPQDKSGSNRPIPRNPPLMQLRADPNIQDKSHHA